MEQLYRLKKLRNKLGLSQAQFAQRINYSLSSISAIEAGNQKLPMKLAYLLQDMVVKDSKGTVRIVTEDSPSTEDETHLRAEWLFMGAGKPFYEDLPDVSFQKLKIDTMSGKSVSLDVSPNVKFFELNDSSMSPAYNKYDIIAVDTAKKDIVSGHIYLINMFDENLIRKIYKLNADEYNIVAENKDLIPPVVTKKSDIKIEGEYIYMIRIE